VRLLPLLVVVYVLSPVDLVPDVVPIVGLLDDLGVIGLLVAALWRELRRIPDGDDAR
jgi:uncharacterized membrane protein YkvA (DUF1232 family)